MRALQKRLDDEAARLATRVVPLSPPPLRAPDDFGTWPSPCPSFDTVLLPSPICKES
jgi:hypothetical protein